MNVTLFVLLLILALVCFLVEAFRANFRINPPPQPPRVHVGWGWLGLALCVAAWLIGPSGHL